LETERNAKKNQLTDIAWDKGFVSTYYFDSGDKIPDPSSDSYAQILTGKCVVSFYGYASRKYREDFIYYGSESFADLDGRPVRRVGTKYHYTEYLEDEQGRTLDGKVVNVHPEFDHGFQELHQKMISLAPQIVEAVKPFCGNTPPEL